MAGSVNKVILVGNLGADPDSRRLASGDLVVNLRVATTESWKDRITSERRDRTEWHNVVIFNDKLIKVAQSSLIKGDKVMVEGQLHTRKWQDKEGYTHFKTEVILHKSRGKLLLMRRATSSLDLVNGSVLVEDKILTESETIFSANENLSEMYITA